MYHLLFSNRAGNCPIFMEENKMDRMGIRNPQTRTYRIYKFFPTKRFFVDIIIRLHYISAKEKGKEMKNLDNLRKTKFSKTGYMWKFFPYYYISLITQLLDTLRDITNSPLFNMLTSKRNFPFSYIVGTELVRCANSPTIFPNHFSNFFQEDFS